MGNPCLGIGSPWDKLDFLIDLNPPGDRAGPQDLTLTAQDAVSPKRGQREPLALVEPIHSYPLWETPWKFF
jgi:hypothetical protein